MKAETKTKSTPWQPNSKARSRSKTVQPPSLLTPMSRLCPATSRWRPVKKLQEHNTVFWPAVTKAFGEVAIEAMAADKKIESLDLSVPMVGDDKWDINFKRSYEHMDMSTKEMKTSYGGGVSASLTVQGARHNRGAMSSVKSDLKAKAMAQFAE